MADAHSTAELFDSGKLDRLAAAVGAEPLAEMLRMMLDSAAEELAKIADARSRGDVAAINAAAHGLKGVSANFGAARVAAIAAELQHETGDVARIDALIDLLKTAVDDTGRAAPGAALGVIAHA